MLAVLASGVMEPELNSESSNVGILKQEHGTATQSCSTQASAWGMDDPVSNTYKRPLSNESCERNQTESVHLHRKIKKEPKDDYELAEEQEKYDGTSCDSSPTQVYTAEPPNTAATSEQWKQVDPQVSMSPVFEMGLASFTADECRQFNENCKQCVFNDERSTGAESLSLHRRRQIRVFEQGGEEPLSKKIRVWKEKRLGKSPVVRAFNQRFINEDHEINHEPTEADLSTFDRGLTHASPHVPPLPRAQLMPPRFSHREHVVPTIASEHHVISPPGHVITSDHRMMSSPGHINRTRESLSYPGLEEGKMIGNKKFNYLRYLLTHSTPNTEQTDGRVQFQGGPSLVATTTEDQQTTVCPTTMPIVLTSPGVVPQDYITEIGEKHQRVPLPFGSSTALEDASMKSDKRKLRHHSFGSNVLERTENDSCESTTISMSNRSRANSNRSRANSASLENSTDNDDYDDDFTTGDISGSRTIVPQIDCIEGNRHISMANREQYISDIQRPYCNIPNDHQVTHINGVMSLPATRETRYGITLGELKRRTGYPEYLTRVDLIAYVRQSKSAGRALLDKYNISTAGQKSRPTILSKMCENEARVLGDGICRMNDEYFPWKTLAKIASNKVTEGKDVEEKVQQKLRAIQNTRTMLKEIYDLTVENKDSQCMKTFEVASHTFGTANILNHLTIFDRLFSEYQNTLIKNNSEV